MLNEISQRKLIPYVLTNNEQSKSEMSHTESKVVIAIGRGHGERAEIGKRQ